MPVDHRLEKQDKAIKITGNHEFTLVVPFGRVVFLAGETVWHLVVAEMNQSQFPELAGTLVHRPGAVTVVEVPVETKV